MASPKKNVGPPTELRAPACVSPGKVEARLLKLTVSRRIEALETDEGVLERAQNQDEAACRALYRQFHPRVFAFLSRMMGGRRAEAEDLLQETFVRVFRALPRFDPKGDARLSTWILTIAYRLALNAARKQRRFVPLVQTDLVAPGGADQSLRQNRIEAALIEAVTRLPPDHRAVFLLRDYHDLPYDEISSVLGVQVGTVKSRLFRARTQVRAHLEPLIHG